MSGLAHGTHFGIFLFFLASAIWCIYKNLKNDDQILKKLSFSQLS
jgi:hypothetical protein